ncbi:MAG: hypothetical protein IV090_27550 [Candidatus Sericytochromatia bacterium]|nr:hypothetical protein [Candidatus Sericytochromatia bacterium]
MRVLSQSFFNDLKEGSGLLCPLLERIKQDHTLMLAIRKDYINIYYRGGNLLRIKELKENYYSAFFDKKYNTNQKSIPDLPMKIESQGDTNKWVKSFSCLKEIMDLYLSKNSKPEREFQQLIARENNVSTISNESEYFISDIEFADSEIGARFDILSIQWLASQRKNGNKCRAALMEIKYGDGALSGTSGLLKHLKDINTLISDDSRYNELLATMEAQFNLLDHLGLLHYRQCSNETKIKLNVHDKPEVIFILANHNPRSTKLKRILENTEIDLLVKDLRFDLRFFVASFAGYGLHSNCMLSLNQFRKLL